MIKIRKIESEFQFHKCSLKMNYFLKDTLNLLKKIKNLSCKKF